MRKYIWIDLVHICICLNRYTMFGEYMKYEQLCKVSRGDGVMGRNEYGLFHEAVYYYQNCSVAG